MNRNSYANHLFVCWEPMTSATFLNHCLEIGHRNKFISNAHYEFALHNTYFTNLLSISKKNSNTTLHLFLVSYICVYEQEQLCKQSFCVLRTYELGNFSKPLFCLCFYVTGWCNFFVAIFLFSYFGHTCKTTSVISVNFNTCFANLLPCHDKQITVMPQIQKLSPHRQD